MANNNSRSFKNSKESFLSPIMEQLNGLFNRKCSISPATSEGSQGHSSKTKIRNFFRSTKIPGRETLLGKCHIFFMYRLNCNPVTDSSTDITPDSVPPNTSSLIMGSSQYLDDRTPPALSGSRSLATPAVQNLDDLSSLQGSATTASAGQSPGENTPTFHGYRKLTPYGLCQEHTSNSAAIKGNSQSPMPNAQSSIKENLKLTGRSLQTLVKRGANIVDSNPAKVALVCKDNKDAVSRQIALTGGQLEEVAEALRDWKRGLYPHPYIPGG
ncbi:hypothetical protein CVT25_013371, partial [Psilocybe cyanescens]